MINIEYANPNEIEINKAEVLRYLGYRDGMALSDVEPLISEAIGEALNAINCRACYTTVDITRMPNHELSLGGIRVSSNALEKNLSGCESAVIFTATVGIGLDRLISRYSRLSPSRAAVMQAIGATAIEGWCDLLTNRLTAMDFMKDKFFRPRFSPGYGDLPISTQKDLFALLDCNRKIGVTLTESLMMLPTKSVSAIIGISTGSPVCQKHRCTDCDKTDCAFKRD